MNTTQKEKIISMRKRNVPYADIADTVGLSVGTVKSFCHRNNITADKKPVGSVCKNCGVPIKGETKTKPRLFCCDRCRQEYWNKHRNERESKKMSPHTCSTCGKVFMDYIGANRKFCSQACYRERSECDGQ